MNDSLDVKRIKLLRVQYLSVRWLYSTINLTDIMLDLHALDIEIRVFYFFFII